MGGQPPEGWDDELDPSAVAGARDLRKTYLSLIAAGFTMQEAAAILAQMMVAMNSAMNRSTPT